MDLHAFEFSEERKIIVFFSEDCQIKTAWPAIVLRTYFHHSCRRADIEEICLPVKNHHSCRRADIEEICLPVKNHHSCRRADIEEICLPVKNLTEVPMPCHGGKSRDV